ncbi:MAG: hypothetical protein Q9227_001348 [Pyrenula ochraceoflavens]
MAPATSLLSPHGTTTRDFHEPLIPESHERKPLLPLYHDPCHHNQKYNTIVESNSHSYSHRHDNDDLLSSISRLRRRGRWLDHAMVAINVVVVVACFWFVVRHAHPGLKCGFDGGDEDSRLGLGGADFGISGLQGRGVGVFDGEGWAQDMLWSDDVVPATWEEVREELSSQTSEGGKKNS